MTNPATTIGGFASAHAMLAALQAGQISATELLELHLARIARYNLQINAIVTPNEEQARQRAADADAAHAQGKSLGPLHGLPLTIKCLMVGSATFASIFSLRLPSSRKSYMSTSVEPGLEKRAMVVARK